MEMAEMALKFILENKSVSTIIPGMRSIRNVTANMNCSSANELKKELLQKLYDHRWDRTPTEWSQ
jgi:aryl-alcohol dehydrogenase-like predicted oxidoreductase